MESQPSTSKTKKKVVGLFFGSNYSATTILTTSAIVAYGTYRIGNFLWNYYNSDNDSITDPNKQQYDPNLLLPDHHYNDNHRDNNTTTTTNDTNLVSGNDYINHVNTYQPSLLYQSLISLTTTRNQPTQFHYSRSKMMIYHEQQLRYDRCTKETKRMIETFLPIIRSKIISLTDMSSATNTLKQIRKHKRKKIMKENHNYNNNSSTTSSTTTTKYSNTSNEEQRCWNFIQIMSFTRFCSTVNIFLLFYIVVLIQCHIIGYRLSMIQHHDHPDNNETNTTAINPPTSEEESIDGSDDKSENHKLSFQNLLSYTLHNVFIERMIPQIIYLIRQVTEQIFMLHLEDTMKQQQPSDSSNHDDNFWNVLSYQSTNVTSQLLQNKISEIQQSVENTMDNNNHSKNNNYHIECHYQHSIEWLLRLLIESSSQQQQQNQPQHDVVNHNHNTDHPTGGCHDDDNQQPYENTCNDYIENDNNNNSNSTNPTLETDPLALHYFHETLDLLESPITRDVWIDCLDQIYHDTINQKCFDNGTTTKPLASLITQLKQLSDDMLQSPGENDSDDAFGVGEANTNDYMKLLDAMPSIRELRYASFYDSVGSEKANDSLR